MQGGTLLVSRLVNWFPHFKKRLESLGFPDVRVTGIEKDGLNMLINELKPKYVLISSNFYDCGTPYMVGQLLKVFPKLNVAVLNTSPFPDVIAAWFIFHGIKFYVKFSDGDYEFHHGLKCILDGKKYIAPDVQCILDRLGEYPVVPTKTTRRQKEILLMICCGFSTKRIVDCLHISKATVENHLTVLFKIFNSRDRGELIKTVNYLGIFTGDELRFNDTSYGNFALPDWANTQLRINQIKLTNNNEKKDKSKGE
jgi:DNA-binding NarL/FixJ family response regulator